MKWNCKELSSHTFLLRLQEEIVVVDLCFLYYKKPGYHFDVIIYALNFTYSVFKYTYTHYSDEILKDKKKLMRLALENVLADESFINRVDVIEYED